MVDRVGCPQVAGHVALAAGRTRCEHLDGVSPCAFIAASSRGYADVYLYANAGDSIAVQAGRATCYTTAG